MWQFQWAISLIPDAMLSWIYWMIVLLGILGIISGWLGKWIPVYGKYASILKPIGIILLVLGVWLRGGYDVEMAWRDKVATLEAKIKQAEEESHQVNNVIEERVVEKTKVIKGKTEYITQYIDREVSKDKEVIKFVENCPLPAIIIEQHNAAALMNAAAEGAKK
jgi:hypothetical protein